jgi:hypothetical protein
MLALLFHLWKTTSALRKLPELQYHSSNDSQSSSLGRTQVSLLSKQTCSTSRRRFLKELARTSRKESFLWKKDYLLAHSASDSQMQSNSTSQRLNFFTTPQKKDLSQSLSLYQTK